MKSRFSLSLMSILIFLGLLVSACASNPKPAGAGSHADMAPLAEMPAEVQQAPVAVQEAYRFAVANPEIISAIPCYCGCGSMGHTSNYSCYVSGQDAEGKLAFDNHALGCSICVDITLDAMRLTRAGKNIEAVYQYVDATYAQYGPSNMAQASGQ